MFCQTADVIKAFEIYSFNSEDVDICVFISHLPDGVGRYRRAFFYFGQFIDKPPCNINILVAKFDIKIHKRRANTDKITENAKNQTEEFPAQRKCVIEGKHFIVTRHFAGDKNLSNIITEIAKNRADREMGL